MATEVLTSAGLKSIWRDARDGYKLEGKKLNPAEVAGLLIEELGSAFAALRLAQVCRDAPLLVDLKNPKSDDWSQVREVLLATWLDESGQQPPTEESLRQAWDQRPADFVIADCIDPTVLAGALISRYGLGQAIQDLGLSLYSPFHEATGFAQHPLAREVLFTLDIVAQSGDSENAVGG